MDILDIRPAGDAAILVVLGASIDLAVNRRVHAVGTRIRELAPPDQSWEIIPGYACLLVSYPVDAADYRDVVETIRHAASTATVDSPSVRRFVLPAVYGGTYAPDLSEVAQICGLTPEEVVHIHTSHDYPIFCLGFSPGFPLLGCLPEALDVPRLGTPRARVPAGSVGIAGGQTGVYPASTPGGWRIIARTPLILFDAHRAPPVAYLPGDLIRFRPVHQSEFESLAERHEMPRADQITQILGEE